MPFVWEAARWVARATGLGVAVDGYLGAVDQIEQLGRLADGIRTYRDVPKSIDELQDRVGNGQLGYDDHHIVEEAAARKSGYSEEWIQARQNLARVPLLKHYEISGWYSRKNEEFGWLTPRQYLSNKSWEERYIVGLRAMRKYGVLK